jgi:Zn-finger nucleic acid-binding protein
LAASRDPYRSSGGGLDCPRCGAEEHLTLTYVEHVAVARCARCRGIWVDRSTLEEILADLGLQFGVRQTLEERGRPDNALPPGAPMYVSCPRCEALMIRRRFAQKAPIVIDFCRKHGVWFDHKELTAAIDFAESTDLTSFEESVRAEIESRPQSPRMGSMEGGSVRHRYGFGSLLSILARLLLP